VSDYDHRGPRATTRTACTGRSTPTRTPSRSRGRRPRAATPMTS